MAPPARGRLSWTLGGESILRPHGPSAWTLPSMTRGRRRGGPNGAGSAGTREAAKRHGAHLTSIRFRRSRPSGSVRVLAESEPTDGGRVDVSGVCCRPAARGAGLRGRADRPAATAEDIAQEVLIRAYARWDTICGLDRPEFYVRKMVLNEFLSWRRRSWRLVPAGDTATAAVTTSDLADQYAERAALLAEIGKLPRRQRAVLVLRYYEDRSDAEIAELLRCRPRTVHAYAQRAAVRDTVPGRTLASVRPPRPYLTFIGLTGAADDRTFVLTAQSTLSGSLTSRNKFYYARFNPADDAVTMTPLALPGLPFSNNLNGAALSPDGTRLAVASQNGAAQIAVYSLPSGAVRV